MRLVADVSYQAQMFLAGTVLLSRSRRETDAAFGPAIRQPDYAGWSDFKNSVAAEKNPIPLEWREASWTAAVFCRFGNNRATR